MNISIRDRYLATEHGRIFARRWHTPNPGRTPIVLLHDSLGCVELWRDFPEQLARATARDVIAYDRLGFGRSAPHPGGWSNRYIRDEAERFFPPVWRALDIGHFIAVGQSAGGIMAASLASHRPLHCRALVTLSALAFVEGRTIQGIRQAQAMFADPLQVQRLRKYHGDKAEWILAAWIDTWLSSSYRDWTIDDSAPGFSCPLLAIHGLEDEYGSAAHPRRILALASGTAESLLLEGCQHVPHREQPAVVIRAISGFLQGFMD